MDTDISAVKAWAEVGQARRDQCVEIGHLKYSLR